MASQLELIEELEAQMEDRAPEVEVKFWLENEGDLIDLRMTDVKFQDGAIHVTVQFA